MRRAAALAVLGLCGAATLALAQPVHAAPAPTGPTSPVYDEQGRLVDTPFAPAEGDPHLTEGHAIDRFLADEQVADWLERYPPEPTTDAEFRPTTGDWTVKVWSRPGQIALGKVDDRTGRVEEAWTGPQVAWKMARGGAGAFGGKTLNSPGVWLAFCAVFLIGLFDWRRPLRVRNFDLLVLLSFGVSLRLFNEGEIFWSVPLAYPPLLWLLGRMLWIGFRGRHEPFTRPLWPIWMLAGAAVFLAGFRVGLNIEAKRSVIDVGYAGVIGAHRIVNGQIPYGHMPVQGSLEACGPSDAEGETRERIQTNGRCESSNDRGDTYGPVSYLAYVPGFLAFGWSGKWDALPAAHATALLFDALAMIGLVLVGLRFGGARLAATLAFAWAAYPFTQFVSNSNTNDSIMPALLVWGFWLASSPWARGVSVALAGWTKFAALILAPLWAGYPDGLRLPRISRFAAGFAVASAAAFAMLLLEPDPLHAARVFAERTLGYQLDRESPFSIWGWGQYEAEGVPDLHLVQRALEVLLVGLALALAFFPRRKSPLQLAALTAALLLGFELVLTHWFYLYIPWFAPFVLVALFLPGRRADA